MFNKKKEDNFEVLQQESNGILDVFTQTLNSLTGINDRIAARKQQKQDEIKAAQEEHDSLHEQQLKNEKVIIKINDFLK